MKDDRVEDKLLRRVRSFVRREGRITIGQQRALDEHWGTFGVDYAEQPLDLDQLYGRQAVRNLEIGFGNGEALVSMAANHPDEDFLGLEVFTAGAGQVIAQALEHNLTNIRVMLADAVEVLTHMIPAESFDNIYIFFPDPWHKKRHNKRRLINDQFGALLATKLKPGANLHLATDWENYAEQMLEVLSRSTALKNQNGDYAPRNERRPVTKFERRGQRLGHGVWDLHFTKS
ncbi:MAG: tRNA (guanosine(46)-N7)-methyltransferase TrmB [Gammaproteobacteria bacterium]|nr:tRNA (guanosine(46)-N7)-methyltransferase TrmB [Gammaproteobacteria bacterium]